MLRIDENAALSGRTRFRDYARLFHGFENVGSAVVADAEEMEVEDSAAFCYDKRKQFGSCAEQGGLKRSGAFSRKLRGVEYYVQ